nr:hypothetical protein Iba_chr12bCG15790 [Ipomoea batatas]
MLLVHRAEKGRPPAPSAAAVHLPASTAGAGSRPSERPCREMARRCSAASPPTRTKSPSRDACCEREGEISASFHRRIAEPLRHGVAIAVSRTAGGGELLPPPPLLPNAAALRRGKRPRPPVSWSSAERRNLLRRNCSPNGEGRRGEFVAAAAESSPRRPQLTPDGEGTAAPICSYRCYVAEKTEEGKKEKLTPGKEVAGLSPPPLPP